jgi:hypothetical protein
MPSETKREDMISAGQKWATGLVEGNGYIGIEWTNSAKTKWVATLKVSLDVYNARAIYKLRQFLKCGQITTSKHVITLRIRNNIHWRDLLLPLWDNFPLRSFKYYDLQCIKRALEVKRDKILQKAEKLNIIANLKWQLKQNRVTMKPSPLWNLKDTCLEQEQRLHMILDLDWLAGYVEAKGRFYILNDGRHGFVLGQCQGDHTHIIKAVHQYYGVKTALQIGPNYVMLDTKDQMTLHTIANTMHLCKSKETIRGTKGSRLFDSKGSGFFDCKGSRFFGMKSFEFSLWLRTLRKQNLMKSLLARQIIQKKKNRMRKDWMKLSYYYQQHYNKRYSPYIILGYL